MSPRDGAPSADSVRRRERALGPDNPELAQTLDNLGNALTTAGQNADALVH